MRVSGFEKFHRRVSRTLAWAVAIFVFSLPPLSWGSAFSIAELGARAAGMGTAFTSIADDGSAMVYNPAGIGFQPGTRFELDNLAVWGLFRFVPVGAPPGTIIPEKGFHGSIRPKFIPVGNMYASHQISPKWTLGFGVFAPFGLSANFTNFNDSDPAFGKFPGRYAGTRARLESIWFQPTAAYRLTPNSRVALGLAFVHTHLSIESSFLNPKDDGLEFGREAAEDIFPGADVELAARSIARLLPEGRSRIAGTSNSPGFSLGYLYKHPDRKYNFGLMYRSPVVHHLEGKASFAFTQNFTLEPFIEDLLDDAFPNQEITGIFVTPATYAVGVSTEQFLDMTFSLDFHFQDYRRFRDVPLNFTITEETDPDARTPAEQRLVFDFRDSFHIAFGTEKYIRPNLAVRAGYLYDRSPVVDKSVGPLFPDANRHSFTFGASMRRGNTEFTAFYEAMQFRNRTTNVAENVNQFTNGEYRNFAHLAGLGIRFVFGPQ